MAQLHSVMGREGDEGPQTTQRSAGAGNEGPRLPCVTKEWAMGGSKLPCVTRERGRGRSAPERCWRAHYRLGAVAGAA